MKKLVSLSFILITLLGCSKESEKITVVLDWTPNTNHTGLYVALEKGYFEEYNLDVEIIQPDGYSEPIVASNTAQFGISAQEYVISARSNDVPVVSLAAIIHDNTSGFISRKSANITRPLDFENKTYCGWGSATESAIIKELVESDGGDFSKVNVTTNYLDIFTDVNNECDFFWVFEAWQVEQAKLENIEYNYLSMIDYSNELNFHTPVIITNEKMIEENSDVIKDFMSAVKKGYEYAISNPNESADILLKHAPELNSELVKSSQTFLANHYKKDGLAWGIQSDTYWTNFNDWLVDHEIVPSININDAYTNEYIEDENN